jgi:NADPH:quinone reductase-like Zn-dependent oxidoreductase
MVGGSGRQIFQAMAYGPFITSKKITVHSAKANQYDLEFLKDLLEKGKIKPVIDRRYALEELPEAMRYLEEGHASGKIIIDVCEDK